MKVYRQAVLCHLLPAGILLVLVARTVQRFNKREARRSFSSFSVMEVLQNNAELLVVNDSWMWREGIDQVGCKEFGECKKALAEPLLKSIALLRVVYQSPSSPARFTETCAPLSINSLHTFVRKGSFQVVK